MKENITYVVQMSYFVMCECFECMALGENSSLSCFVAFSDLIEDIDSPEEDSCNSSRFTNKSGKNMSDFEGEEIVSEDELVSISAHSHFVGLHPMQHQLANLASIYHKQLPQSKVYAYLFSVQNVHCLFGRNLVRRTCARARVVVVRFK